jgi:hypothetical protein
LVDLDEVKDGEQGHGMNNKGVVVLRRSINFGLRDVRRRSLQ